MHSTLNSEIGKETIGSKQVIQFHCFCFEKWTKNQNFWEVVSNQRIKKQSFRFTDSNQWIKNQHFWIIDSNQRIKKQLFWFTGSNQWIKKHFFHQLFLVMNQEPVDFLFLCQSLPQLRRLVGQCHDFLAWLKLNVTYKSNYMLVIPRKRRIRAQFDSIDCVPEFTIRYKDDYVSW